MAECQRIYDYSGHEVIEEALSSQRINTYSKASGQNKPEYAIELYLYNSRLSKAFLFPLHALEIILRNAIDGILETKFGYDWPNDESFISVLSEESNNSLSKAKERVNKEKGAKGTAHDVVAQLTFDFWSNLFRPHYEHTVWLNQMGNLLPHTSYTRKKFQTEVAELNKFRNRIAHHEPIFQGNSQATLKKILDVIHARNPILADWVKSHTTVNSILETRPVAKGGYGPELSSRMDTSIASIDANENLAKLIPIKEKFTACYIDKSLVAILTNEEIGSILLKETDDSGLVDLNEIKIIDAIKSLKLERNYKLLSKDESVLFIKRFFKKNINYVAVIDDKNKQLLGVIAKAHRQYG